MPRRTLCFAFAGAAAISLLAGCSSIQEAVDRESGPKTVAYRCDSDRDFAAVFSTDGDQAFVETGDKTYELNRAGHDNGAAVYTNRDNVELTVDGNDAYLRIPDQNDFEDCRARAQA
ncbi:MAG: hypothetical protein ACREH6_03985 [Geminicoccaceae bacterium]